MKEQSSQPTNEVKKIKNIWAIILAVVITASIIGGSVYVWQSQRVKELQDEINALQSQINQIQAIKSQLEESRKQLQQQITDVEKEKLELEKKYCKGTWKNGICVGLSCVDSDVNEKPDDIYIKGKVTYTDENGVATTVNDECTGSKKQVIEMWCYESPRGSGNYVQGKKVYDCPNGCFDGACVK